MTRLALLVALGALACASETAPRALVGDPAPRYAATTLAGDSVSTGGLTGKVVLLNVWATWCAPCREEIPFLQTLYERHKGDGLEIIGVSVDARGQEETIHGFVKDFGMTYPIWRDPDERVQSLYMALGVPASYIIDRRGILRWRRLGIVRESDSTFSQALAHALNGGT
jgi:thiol-disulfide isomerase/thioredoxin